MKDEFEDLAMNYNKTPDLFASPVVDPPVAAAAAVADPPPVAAAAVVPGSAVKSAVREMYISSVRSAWLAFDEVEIHIYQNYTEAFKLGQVSDDKTARDKNLALVFNWDNLAKRLDELFDSYHKAEPDGARLKCVQIFTLRLGTADYIPRLTDGRMFVADIHARSIVGVYQELAKYFERYPDVFYRKFHRGARILVAEGDSMESKLFGQPQPAPDPALIST